MPEKINDIVDALLRYKNVGDQSTQTLVVDSNGHLACRTLTTREKIAKFFGLGSASDQNIIRLLQRHEAELHALAKTYKQEGKDELIETLQLVINGIFEKRGQLKKAPDLYMHINEHWMQELPVEVKQKRMREFVIPGTHDSAAYQLDLKRTPKGKWRIAARAANFFKFIGLKKAVSEFTLTQHYDFEKQLQLGARYFDLRICYDESRKEYYLSHTFACVRLQEALAQFKKFIETHPHEIILLQIEADEQHRENFTAAHTDEMLKLLNDSLGQWSVRHDAKTPSHINGFGDKTYQELIESQQRVVFGFPGRNKIAQPSAGVSDRLKEIWWQSNLNNEGWLGCNSVEAGLKKMSEKITFYHAVPQKMHCVAASLTPKHRETATGIVRRVLPTFKKFKALNKSIPSTIERGREMNDALKKVVGTNEENRFQGIMYCDSPDHSNAFNYLIKQNRGRKK